MRTNDCEHPGCNKKAFVHIHTRADRVIFLCHEHWTQHQDELVGNNIIVKDDAASRECPR
jgi:hypothetical protein